MDTGGTRISGFIIIADDSLIESQCVPCQDSTLHVFDFVELDGWEVRHIKNHIFGDIYGKQVAVADEKLQSTIVC